MTARSTLLVLVVLLSAIPSWAPAAAEIQTAEPSTPDTEATAEAASPEPAAPAEPMPFKPAAVGLAGLPEAPATPADFDKAVALIEQRLKALTGTAGPGAEGADVDPRIESLEALRLALQQEASFAERSDELDAAIAEQQAQRAAFERDGLGGEPPYSITLLDQLQTERRLGEQAAQGAAQALQAAQRRVAAAEKELAAAERTRRQVRDQAVEAKTDTSTAKPAQTLEAARLSTLAGEHRLTAARARLALAEREKTLADARLALKADQIAAIGDDVTFPRKVLDDKLAELAEREASLERRIAALNQTADAAEGTLFETRRRGARTDNANDKVILEAQIAAREAELAAARRGADYLRQAVDDLATARTLWERRYALMQGGDAEKAALADWLSEARDLLGEIGEREGYIDAEIGTLRSMQLALSRRLAEPDLEPRLNQALQTRHAALDTQQGRAEELLVVQDQLRSLVERLVDELEPRVRERSFGQRLEEIESRLVQWWGTELFVVRDQGIYVRDLATGFGVFALVLVAVSLLRVLLRRTLLPRLTNDEGQERRTARAIVLALIRNTNQLFVLVVAFYAAMTVSGLAAGQMKSWLWTLLVVIFWLQIGIWATAGAVDLVNRQRSRRELRDPSAVSGYGLILFFVRVGIWAVVVVSVLTHFDYPITGLVGALGVGGIAIAFAVQNILADVFNSMAIILDKPFRVGDFIVTGETLGVVEQIGVKTTQIRSLSGEQVILSNTDILNSRIRNYKRMRERRVVFRLGVVYQTPPDKLERIPRIIEAIIRGQSHARFDRAHFFEYGDFALVFEIVYYVLGADYNLYMDTQQAINLAIYRRFEQEGIAFAYPTQEVIVRRHSDAR